MSLRRSTDGDPARLDARRRLRRPDGRGAARPRRRGTGRPVGVGAGARGRRRAGARRSGRGDARRRHAPPGDARRRRSSVAGGGVGEPGRSGSGPLHRRADRGRRTRCRSCSARRWRVQGRSAHRRWPRSFLRPPARRCKGRSRRSPPTRATRAARTAPGTCSRSRHARISPSRSRGSAPGWRSPRAPPPYSPCWWASCVPRRRRAGG